MRREHKESQSYIDWLKSIGCLIYLPLSEDGDVQDRISGLSLTFSGNGSMAWDSDEGMYVVTGLTTRNGYVAILPNGMNGNWFPEQNYTSLCTVKAIKRQQGYYIRTHAPYSYNSNTCACMSAGFNGTGNSGAWPSYAFNNAYYCDHSNHTRGTYIDGVLEWSTSENASYLPQNWILQGNGFIIGPSDQYGNGSQSKYSIKEIYLFNAVLDLQTIRKIQGYV